MHELRTFQVSQFTLSFMFEVKVRATYNLKNLVKKDKLLGI